MPKVRFNAVRDAIRSEKEAHDIYIAMKDKAEEENSKRFCEEMAREELRHMKMLEELGSQDLKFLLESVERAGGFKLDVVVHLDRPVQSYELKELFEFALKKEAESISRYRQLAKASEDLKDFFSDLAEMEKNHARMVRVEYEHYKKSRLHP